MSTEPANIEPEKQKRTWVYPQPPISYGFAPCQCGNVDTQWSEFVVHLWCATCKKDFIPAHGGVFDGPIPIEGAALMGMYFDRVQLDTGNVQVEMKPEHYEAIVKLGYLNGLLTLAKKREASAKESLPAVVPATPDWSQR